MKTMFPQQFAPAILTVLIAIATFLATSPATAAERKDPRDVSLEALLAETQRSPDGAGSDHVALAWWIPVEFWEAVFTQDTNVNDALRQGMLSQLVGHGFLAVVQADISPFGEFSFYDEAAVKDGLVVETNHTGEATKITAIERVDPSLALLLSQIKPILTAAMGNMGQNLHFLVFSDPSDNRVFDPFDDDEITITLRKRAGNQFQAHLNGPVDALHVPRICPNGREAHVSWKFCPWSGAELPD